MAYDEGLAGKMREALKGRRVLREVRMFGGICWMLNGNMICGVEKGRYMFRVGKEAEMHALSLDGASPMDITGTPMAGFVWVDPRSTVRLKDWVALATKYAGNLPPKAGGKSGPTGLKGASKRKKRA